MKFSRVIGNIFMKPFRTVLRADVSKCTLNFQSKIITIGSCFSDAIGHALQTHKIHTLINPFGALYSPLAIHKVLTLALENKMPSSHGFVVNQEIHSHTDFHSRFSALTRAALADLIHQQIEQVHGFLKTTDTIIITYGSAFVYSKNETGEAVANCHKLPASNFKKRLLTNAEIEESFAAVLTAVMKHRPDVQIIVTVSPVRHIKDTLPLNSVSKSTLRLSCHSLVQHYKNVHYFPSYEIMQDDLRDYRFYKQDMIHPTKEAEEYIWEMFQQTHCTSETRGLIGQWDAVLNALSHKPFHTASSAHQQFLRATLAKLNELKAHVNVDEEVAVLEKQLIH